MSTQSHITPQLARVFGLRPGVSLDEKLARALTNPRSKCAVRFIKCRGLSAVYVGGMWLESVGAEIAARPWLSSKAERLPELPHLKTWAENL